MLNYTKLYKKIFGDTEPMNHWFPRNMEYLLNNQASELDAKIVRLYFTDHPTYAKVAEALGISDSYVGMRLQRFYRICRTRHVKLLENGIVKVIVEKIPDNFNPSFDFKVRKNEELYTNEALGLVMWNMLRRNNITTWGALKALTDEQIKKYYAKHNAAKKIIDLRDRIEIID